MGLIWFQNRSLFCALRSFLLPHIALTIAVRNLCAVLLSHPILAITCDY